jgi:hypothetical protein
VIGEGHAQVCRFFLWLVLACVVSILVATSRTQEIKHAPTVEQCRADQRLWLDKIESDPSANMADYVTLNGWTREMLECRSVDPDNQHRYYNVVGEIASVRIVRLERFLDRHGLYDKFIEEDKAGKK